MHSLPDPAPLAVMAANPPLTQSAIDGSLVPTPYDGEQGVLGRDKGRLINDNVRTASGK